MGHLAKTLMPPYVTATVRVGDAKNLNQQTVATAALEELISIAPKQQDFLGLETIWTADGKGRTVSYWRSRDAVWNWRQAAQARLSRLFRGLSLEQACEIEVSQVRRRLFDFLPAKPQTSDLRHAGFR